MNICAEDGCTNKVNSRGYCKRHYEIRRVAGLFVIVKQDYPKGPCSIVGCNTPAKYWSSGQPLCDTCQRRWMRYGSLEPSRRMVLTSLLEVVKTDVSVRDRSECWKWEERLSAGGYPLLGSLRAHHLVLELDGHSRPEAPANHALHSCDNKWCYNPAHLRWGTQKENSRDYAERWGFCPHCDHCTS